MEVSRTLENFKQNCTNAKMFKTFEPFIYNIWNTQKGNETVHFGSFPEIFMENLIYYHTNIYDIIYDPFAGAGTTVDVCKKWLRRYYCSDRIIKAGREKDIKNWDIKDGLPKDLRKPDLVFLDPPYWKQAENKYSTDKDDLANMELLEFNTTISKFLDKLIKRKIQRIAILIAPTQYSSEKHKFIHHIFDFYDILKKHYEIEMQYEIPNSTEQYNGTQVEIMKKEKKAINIKRELTVFQLK